MGKFLFLIPLSITLILLLVALNAPQLQGPVVCTLDSDLQNFRVAVEVDCVEDVEFISVTLLVRDDITEPWHFAAQSRVMGSKLIDVLDSIVSLTQDQQLEVRIKLGDLWQSWHFLGIGPQYDLRLWK